MCNTKNLLLYVQDNSDHFLGKMVFKTLSYFVLTILQSVSFLFKMRTVGQDIKTCSHDWYNKYSLWLKFQLLRALWPCTFSLSGHVELVRCEVWGGGGGWWLACWFTKSLALAERSEKSDLVTKVLNYMWGKSDSHSSSLFLYYAFTVYQGVSGVKLLCEMTQHLQWTSVYLHFQKNSSRFHL